MDDTSTERDAADCTEHDQPTRAAHGASVQGDATAPERRFLPASSHGHAPARLIEHRPCAAWSPHAALLAELPADQMTMWADDAGSLGALHEGSLVLLRPGCAVPRDLVRTSAARAVAVGCAAGADLRAEHVIGGRSAAWVWAGGEPPPELELHTLGRPIPAAGISVHQPALLLAREIERIGGCPVTSPVRTACDILRFSDEESALTWCRRLLDSGQLDPARMPSALRRIGGLPHAVRARERWDALPRIGPSAPMDQERRPALIGGAMGQERRPAALGAAGESMRCPSPVTR